MTNEKGSEMERAAETADNGTERRDDGPKPPPNPYNDPMNTEPPRAPNPPPMGGKAPPPPYGTYPPPAGGPMPQYQYTPPPYAPPEPPKKTRRVGTLTMALCLIAAGVLLVMRVFLPNIDYLFILRLSPVVLILLGLEMVVANIRFKEEKLRYDFLSVFISILLIGGSLAAAAIPEAVTWSVNNERVANRVAASLDVATADLLTQDAGLPVYNIDWYIGLYGTSFDSDMTYGDLRPEHNVQVQVYMPGDYKSEAAFAKDCRTALDYLLTVVPHINYASFYDSRTNNNDGSYDGDTRYTLWLDGTAAMRQTVDQLAEQVETEYWVESDRYYLDAYSYRERQAMPEDEGDEPLESDPGEPEDDSAAEDEDSDSQLDDAA